MLTEYQENVVIDMARADYLCGHPMVNFNNEILPCMEEDEDLKDDAEAAAQFYQELALMGAPAFFEEYGYDDDYDETSSTLDDNDWDEDDDPLYGEGEDDD